MRVKSWFKILLIVKLGAVVWYTMHMEQGEKSFKEQEIAELERLLEEKKRALGKEKGAPLEQKEMLREIVREEFTPEREDISAASPPPAAAHTHPQDADSVTEIQALPEDQRLHALVDMVFTKGIYKAVHLTQRMNDPYLTDAFHDALVDALYEELVRRGVMKPSA